MFDFCGGRLVRVCRHCFFALTELLATLSVIYNVTLIVLLSALRPRHTAGVFALKKWVHPSRTHPHLFMIDLLNLCCLQLGTDAPNRSEQFSCGFL